MPGEKRYALEDEAEAPCQINDKHDWPPLSPHLPSPSLAAPLWVEPVTQGVSHHVPPAFHTHLSRDRRPRAPLRRYPNPSCAACPGSAT
jgi:hypothetical protein